jgi:guanylate kinase
MRHHLIALVGPPGVGKTYFTDYLVRTHPETFAITRSVTTRAPRNADDHEHYVFFNDAQFAEGVASGHILATAHVRDKQYGLDLAYIREMLKTHNGVIALVAETVELLRTIPDLAPLLRVIFLKPASRAVLEHNLAMREPDPAQRAANLALAETWAFPERPDATLIVRGEKEQLPELAQQLFSLIDIPKKSMESSSEKKILIATCALLIIIASALVFKYVYTLQPTKADTPNNTASVAHTPTPKETSVRTDVTPFSKAMDLLQKKAVVASFKINEDTFVALTDTPALWLLEPTKGTSTLLETNQYSLMSTANIALEKIDPHDNAVDAIKISADSYEGAVETANYFREADGTFLASSVWAQSGEWIGIRTVPKTQGGEELRIAMPQGDTISCSGTGAQSTTTIEFIVIDQKRVYLKNPLIAPCVEQGTAIGPIILHPQFGKPYFHDQKFLSFTLPNGVPIDIDLEHPAISLTSDAFAEQYPLQ